MPLPPFGPEGDLPEGLHQVSIAEFFAYFGSETPQRVRLAARLQQVFDLVRPYAIVARVIVWGSFVSAKPDPADIDLLWVTLPTFDRGRLPIPVDTLFDPVLAKRLYGIDVLSVPEGSTLLPTLLDGLAITRAFTRRGLVEVRL